MNLENDLAFLGVLSIIFKVIKTKLFSKLDRFEQNGGNFNVS